LLKIAGAEIPQICAITGHSLASATQILEKYMARNSALADAAIHRLETARETAFANRLQTTPRRAIVAPKFIPKEQGDSWYRRPGSNGGPPDPQSGALTN
jgi:hypothetical protein